MRRATAASRVPTLSFSGIMQKVSGSPSIDVSSLIEYGTPWSGPSGSSPSSASVSACASARTLSAS